MLQELYFHTFALLQKLFHEVIFIKHKTVLGLVVYVIIVSNCCIPIHSQVSCLSQELPVGHVNFKFEPFVLHVLCATLEAAADMVSCDWYELFL